MTKTAVIFDLDGTLAPTIEVLKNYFVQRVQELTQKTFTTTEFYLAYHFNLKTFLHNLGIKDPEIIKTIDQEISDLEHRQKDSAFFEGLSELIKELHQAEFDLYLWTLRYEKSALEILKFNQVLKYFVDHHCGDHDEPKPSERGIKVKLISNYQKIYMIGDTVADMQGGKNIGATNIGVTWAKTNTEQMLLDEGADFLIDNVADLRKLLLDS